MNSLRLIIPLSLVLLTACGGAGPGAYDPGNGTVPPAGDCRVTVTDDLTVPLRLENGEEECDYWFPGDSQARKHWYVESQVTIEPGTVLRFGPNATLHIREGGSLQAVGTAAEPVVFEGLRAEHGYWYGLCFSDNAESALEHVHVRWGGGVPLTGQRVCRGAIGGSGTFGEPVHIMNSSVSGSASNGLNAHQLNLGEFSGNEFFGNLEYGVNIEAGQVFKLDAASDYLGEDSGVPNGRPYVYASGTIDTSGYYHPWQNLNAPYFVSDSDSPYLSNITVSDDAGLLLEEGVQIVFSGLSRLSVSSGSMLFAEGTAENKVVLRGLDEEPGSWVGLHMFNAGAQLEHMQVLWAGRPSTYQGSIVIGGAVRPDLDSFLRDVTVDGSEDCAVRFHNPDRSSPADFEEFDVRDADGNELVYCGL